MVSATVMMAKRLKVETAASQVGRGQRPARRSMPRLINPKISGVRWSGMNAMAITMPSMPAIVA